MSIFDYPRISFSGRLRLNPGTANNEDYAQPGGGQALMPDTFPDFAGDPMGLLETAPAQVQDYGMSDDDYIAWIQQFQQFDMPGKTGATELIMPAEWNYYGDMSSTAVDIKVVGVQSDPGVVHSVRSADCPLTDVIGAALSFYGNITDINPEGSPPATQFFVDDLELSSKETTFITGGQTSKAVGLWINFYRNVNLQADDGSGTYLHHVITGAEVSLPGFEDADGIVMRYYISLPLLDDPDTGNQAVLEQYYRDKRQNPKTLDIVGTFAPYYENEPIAMPPGRQLISRKRNITTPTTHNNGGGHIALAPAVAHQDGPVLTVDLSGTFPDAYVGADRENPKFDFGEVLVRVAIGEEYCDIGPVDYLDGVTNDQRGWLFDFNLDEIPGGRARDMLDNPAARLELFSPQFKTVSAEVDYYVVTDQLAVYAEQNGPDDEFVSQGPEEPVTVSVYHRGEKLSGGDCPPITMWQYRSAPIESPGDRVELSSTLAPGEPIRVSTADPGAYLLTFHITGETNPPADGFPPTNYGAFAYPPATFVVTWAPQISVRVLPADDYSKYYVDPLAAEPEANDLLTWDVVYDQVLRTYALLYPAMNNKIDLRDEKDVTRFAPYIISATAKQNWLSTRYMPPTRDLSASRRALLHAWCRKATLTSHRSASEP